MATYTQIGSVTVEAFQWRGGALSSYALPVWAKRLALHASGDTLCVPSRCGTLGANKMDWVVQGADGGIDVVPNAHFTLLYH
jgi:hypothetical protein